MNTVFNPLTYHTFYKKIVLPSALYGFELWTNLSINDTNSLRKMQHYSLKRLLNLRTLTQSDMVESLLGKIDIMFEIDRKKVMFFQKLSLVIQQSVYSFRDFICFPVIPVTCMGILQIYTGYL